MATDSNLPQEPRTAFRNPTIQDLLLVTVAVAICLAVNTAIMDLLKEQLATEENIVQVRPMWSAWVFVYSIINGFLISSIVWFSQIRKLHGKYFLHPGHWLISIFGFYALANFVGLLWSVLVTSFADASSYEWVSTGLLVLSIPPSLTGWLICLFAAIRLKGMWRLAFIIQLIPKAIFFFVFARFFTFSQIYFIQVVPEILIGLVLIIPISMDLYNKVGRDWLHWLAVIIAILQMLIIPIINWIALVQMNLI